MPEGREGRDHKQEEGPVSEGWKGPSGTCLISQYLIRKTAIAKGPYCKKKKKKKFHFQVSKVKWKHIIPR